MDNIDAWNISQRLKLLYESPKFQDVEFHLQNNDTGAEVVLRAHRLILAVCSPVFEALCYGPMATKNPVVISDIDPRVFEVMLKYLYTDTLELESVEVASSLFYAANKYMIPSLRKLTCDFLINSINESNCLYLYNFASVFGEEKLANESWNYVCSHLTYASKYVTGDILYPEVLLKLSDADMLDCDEIVLIELCQLWAENKCEVLGLEKNGKNFRELLQKWDIFKNIRWNLLRKDQLESVEPGLLTDKEIFNITNCVSTELCYRLKPPVKLFFLYRFVETGNCSTITREGITVSTKVTPNKSMMLLGIFVCPTYGFTGKPYPYLERMIISITDEYGKMLVKDLCFKEETETGMQLLINLLNSVPLQGNCTYDIRIRLLNPCHLYEIIPRSSCAKVPSGICVNFVDSADLYEDNVFIDAPHLSLITGLKLSA